MLLAPSKAFDIRRGRASSASQIRSVGSSEVPATRANVLLVCGDIIADPREDPVRQIKLTVDKLDKVNAGLKLIIAGNHDEPLDADMVKGKRGWLERRETILRMFKEKNITYLSEGRRDFVLENGARLWLYASPATTKQTHSCQGFTYTRSNGYCL